jgi:hypothetical protein
MVPVSIFLFSTSEAEAKPLVWSLNKLELKLPQQVRSSDCQLSPVWREKEEATLLCTCDPGFPQILSLD